MKKYFLILSVIILSSNLYAGITDSLSIGFGGGYSSYNTFRGEIYLKSDLKMFNRKTELKIGMNNRSYQLTFDNVSDLDASSIGFFGDIAIYPFNKGLFTGIRWELINFNWLSDDSKTKIENERNYTPTSLYTGTCMFFQLGYRLNISDNFGIKLYGQPGFQQFKISNGTSSSGSYVQTTSTDDPIIEDHYEFIYNINLSIEIRLK
ncbi:hypothetical protein [Geofilum rhodophaeum]|uniref:hypothetical protein n=1 Tax=Geofilum rhodophaeum TaxID=1965019 RepID=UPI000B524E83|nr:hypothetical protein [Geofilum rhodophaeum]